MQDFNEIIDRSSSHSYKYDLRKKIFGSDEVFPMWVADTDFKAPTFILEAMQKRLDHGIFGYTIPDKDYYSSIAQWQKDQHGWDISPDMIKFSPGVVPSLYACVQALTEPGDKVVVQPPVYYPFYSAINECGRQLVTNSLILENGRYRMNIDDFKSKIDNRTRLFFLCNPHNPGGMVWTKAELLEICTLCLENNITIISDEIHSDIVFKGFKHIPVATLSPEISQITVTLNSPSKTFNIAGLDSSYIISSNPVLLKKVSWFFEGMHISPGIFSIEATKAAYLNGREWVQDLISYFTINAGIVRNFLKQHLPLVELIEPEATYLLWLDFRKLKLSRKELSDILTHKAKVGLSDGFQFGVEGDGFRRMNIGCPTIKVQEALNSLFKALTD